MSRGVAALFSRALPGRPKLRRAPPQPCSRRRDYGILLWTEFSSMGARNPARTARRPARGLPKPLVGALSLVGLLAAVGAVLSLGYLLFIVLSDVLASPVVAGSFLDDLIRNVSLARSVFAWSLWLVVISYSIRHYDTEASGFVVLIAGVACWVVLPYVVEANVSKASAAPLQELGRSLIASFQTSGGALMILGLLRVVIGRVILRSGSRRDARLPSSRFAAAEIASQRAEERPSPMRRCWELQFCRGSLRSNCPRFLEGTSCWKTRSGCYCDQGLATSLLNVVGARSRLEVAEEFEAAQRQTQALASSRRAGQKGKRPRPPCGECPIYLEHQTYKYRVVSWLAYPAAAAVIGFTLMYINTGYDWLVTKLEWLGVPIDRTGQGDVYYLPQWLSFQNVMVILVGIFVVGIILHVTELLIFRFKW